MAKENILTNTVRLAQESHSGQQYGNRPYICMKKQQLTLSQVVNYLKEQAVKAGSQKALAEELGVSSQYLGDVISEKREPGKKILSALKLRKVIKYESEAE